MQASLTDRDTAGGTIRGSSRVIDGTSLAVVGDAVDPHGRNAHSNATMAQGSARFKIDGKGVCSAGDLATCGHSATGSSRVWVD